MFEIFFLNRCNCKSKILGHAKERNSRISISPASWQKADIFHPRKKGNLKAGVINKEL